MIFFYKALKVNEGNSRKILLSASKDVGHSRSLPELFPSERSCWYDLFGKCSHLQCWKWDLVKQFLIQTC